MRKEKNKPIEPVGYCSVIYEWLVPLAAAIMFCTILFNVIIGIVTVNGESMEPTYYDGDRIIVSRIVPKYSYGDVVVINVKDDAVIGTTNIIKRVVGVPGDVIEITPEGYVKVNGEYEELKLPETYNDGIFDSAVTVPEGCLYVLGDNRGVSYDSRYLGFIDESQVYGRELIRVWKRHAAIAQ